jgi:DNA-binding XRE family transcriptional regulator
MANSADFPAVLHAITIGTSFTAEQRRQPKRLILTPAQCRAARALLNWTQPFLAEAAGLSKSTIIDFELKRREVSATAQAAMKRALDDGGISFVEENGEGEGVRRRKRINAFRD